MDMFMLDSNIIGEKTEDAYRKISDILSDFREFEEIARNAYDEINDHNELEHVYYPNLQEEQEYLEMSRKKYQKFGGTLSGYGGNGQKLIPNSYGGFSNTEVYSGYMGYNLGANPSQGEGIMTGYKFAADYIFFTDKEALVEKLSNTNLVDIKINNNLNIKTDTITTLGPKDVRSKLKDKIDITDLLKYGEISDALKKQYTDNKSLVDEYNKSLVNYDPDDYPENMPDNLKQACFELTKERRSSINNYSDYVNFIVTEADFNFETINEKAITTGLDLTLVVGVVKLGIQGVVGEDLVTGRKTNNLERILSMVPAGISAAGKIELKTITEATKGNSVILSMNGMGGGKNILEFKTAAESTAENIVAEETSKILTEDVIKGVSNPNLEELKGLIKNGKVSGNNIISQVDENTQIIFRDDTGVNAHPVKPNGYIDPVDHYNVEIQTKTPAGKWKSKWSYHIVLDDKSNIINRFD